MQTVQTIRLLVAGIVLKKSVASHVFLNGRFTAIILVRDPPLIDGRALRSRCDGCLGAVAVSQ